ncbi:MAG: hypothetical protein ACE15D_18820 [Candidatus Eisenbacteria bacterium]
MDIYVQLPEAIRSIKLAQPSANSSLLAAEAWDTQPLHVTGDILPTFVLEPFAEDELTGLWRVTVNGVPASSAAVIEVITAAGTESGLYSTAAPDLERHVTSGEVMWFIELRYQVSRDAECVTRDLLLPLEFDREDRSLAIGRYPTSSSRVLLRHGRGVRLPGVFRTKGYLMFKGRSGTSYDAPFMLETTKNIVVRFGLFGAPPDEPGFEIRVGTPSKSSG